jgi:hypothetical protein
MRDQGVGDVVSPDEHLPRRVVDAEDGLVLVSAFGLLV